MKALCNVTCQDTARDALMYLGALFGLYLLLCVTGVMGLIERHFDKHRSDFSEWERELHPSNEKPELFDYDREV